MKKISVIVPVYNAEKYLGKCVDSILNQSLQNLELILVNDGSVDSSGELCEAYAKKDNRVGVIYIKNQGASKARNIGLAAASGEFISFVDADDWIDKAMYSDMLEEMNRKAADLVMCSYLIFDGEKESYVETPWEDHGVFQNKEIAERVIPAFLAPMDIDGNSQQKVMGSVWKCLFRKQVIESNQIVFDTNIKYIEDQLFLLQFLSKADKVISLSAPYYHYRREVKQKTSITQKYMPELYSHFKLCNACICDILRDIGYFDKLALHRAWMTFSTVLMSTLNISRKASPYKFSQRVQQAKYYITDSGFKQSVQVLGATFFSPKQKMLVKFIQPSLVSIVVAYHTLKNRVKEG